MPKVAVQIWESRRTNDCREEVRLDHLSGWVLPYATDTKVEGLAALIEQAFSLHHPSEPQLDIRYLKDAPKGDYEGGMLNRSDYASVIFDDQDTVRVYRSPPPTQAITAQLMAPPDLRFGSVAPESCAARPAKRLREQADFSANRYVPLAPMMAKRRKLGSAQIVSSLEEEEECVDEGPIPRSRTQSSIVVANSQLSPKDGANTYGTPQSLSASGSAIGNHRQVIHSSINSPSHSINQEAIGERTTRRASTPKSESQELDNGLVHSVPISKDATPAAGQRLHYDLFVKPALPASTARIDREGVIGRNSGLISQVSEFKTPDSIVRSNTSTNTPTPHSDRSRVSSAKALSADVLGKSGRKHSGKDIFEVPSDVEESSQPLPKRIPKSLRSRQAQASRESMSTNVKANFATEAPTGGGIVLPAQSHVYEGSRDAGEDPQEPELPKLFRYSDETTISSRISRDDDDMDVDAIHEGQDNRESPKTDMRESTEANAARAACHLIEESVGDKRREPASEKRRETDRNERFDAGNKVPATSEKTRDKRTTNQQLEESLRAEKEETRGLTSAEGRTPRFSTAHIPAGSSAPGSAIRTPSVHSRKSPTLGKPKEPLRSNMSRSVSFAADEHWGADRAKLSKNPQRKEPNATNKVDKDKPTAKAKKPTSRQSFLGDLMKQMDTVQVPQHYIEKAMLCQHQGPPKRGSTATTTLSTKASVVPEPNRDRSSLISRTEPVGGKATTLTAKKSLPEDEQESDEESQSANVNSNEAVPGPSAKKDILHDEKKSDEQSQSHGSDPDEERQSEDVESEEESPGKSFKSQSVNNSKSSGREEEFGGSDEEVSSTSVKSGSISDRESSNDVENSEEEEEPDGVPKPAPPRSGQSKAEKHILKRESSGALPSSDDSKNANSVAQMPKLIKPSEIIQQNSEAQGRTGDVYEPIPSRDNSSTRSQSQSDENELRKKRNSSSDIHHDPRTQGSSDSIFKKDRSGRSRSTSAMSTDQCSISKSVSMANSRTPAREVQSSAEASASASESESDPDRNSDKEALNPAKGTSGMSGDKTQQSANGTGKEKPEELQESTSDGQSEASAAGDSSSKSDSSGDSQSSDESEDESQDKSEGGSEDSDEEVMFPISKASSNRGRAVQKSAHTNVMDDAERQLQQEATQSMDTHQSPLIKTSAKSKSIAMPKSPTSQNAQKTPKISRTPADHQFPSFSQILSTGNGTSKPRNGTPNAVNPAYKNPVRKAVAGKVPAYQDSTDSESASSNSEDSDDDDLNVRVADKATTTNSSGKKARGRYSSLLKYAQGKQSK